VITLEHSSWAMADLPAGMSELVLRLTRRGDAVEIRYGVDDGEMELAALAYLPPGDLPGSLAVSHWTWLAAMRSTPDRPQY
jgi:regulation of enolase protein 1 (concanavalin A-like superfamily)